MQRLQQRPIAVTLQSWRTAWSPQIRLVHNNNGQTDDGLAQQQRTSYEASHTTPRSRTPPSPSKGKSIGICNGEPIRSKEKVETGVKVDPGFLRPTAFRKTRAQQEYAERCAPDRLRSAETGNLAKPKREEIQLVPDFVAQDAELPSVTNADEHHLDREEAWSSNIDSHVSSAERVKSLLEDWARFNRSLSAFAHRFDADRYLTGTLNKQVKKGNTTGDPKAIDVLATAATPVKIEARKTRALFPPGQNSFLSQHSPPDQAMILEKSRGTDDSPKDDRMILAHTPAEPKRGERPLSEEQLESRRLWNEDPYGIQDCSSSNQENVTSAISGNGVERHRELFAQHRGPVKKEAVQSEDQEKKLPSLFEELFPEEAKRLKDMATESKQQLRSFQPQSAPRLTPFEVDASGEIFRLPTQIPRESPNMATVESVQEQGLSILCLASASTSLVEDDFQRMGPRGSHIAEWQAVGQFQKVIPAREPFTLLPKPFYFLIFANSASAQSYQSHVAKIHNMSQKHTPTSLESPLPLLPGTQVHGMDAYAAMQDHTLKSPSQALMLWKMIPPFGERLDRVISSQGYPGLVGTSEGDKAGRSVLFWVDGYKPSTSSVHTFLAKDGQDRGMQWAPLVGKGSVERLQMPAGEDGGDDDHDSEYPEDELADETPKPKNGRQWLISFEDENEARRFERTWHRRPYTFPLSNERPTPGAPVPLIHAEFVW